MPGTSVGDPPLAALPWPDGLGATVELRTPYVNFDLVDELRRLLFQATDEMLGAGRTVLVLDLTAVSVIDSSGAALLVELDRQVRARGAALWLVGVASFLHRVFSWMHVETRLALAANEDEVRRTLATRSG